MLTVLAAFGTMLLAEGTTLEVSGVLSLVTLGLTMAAKGKFFVSPEASAHLDTFWHLLGHLANTAIFFTAGLITVAKAMVQAHDVNVWWKVVLLWVFLHVARAVTLFLLWPILSNSSYEFTLAHGAATVYGGLRGAVGLTLALVVTPHPHTPVSHLCLATPAPLWSLYGC